MKIKSLLTLFFFFNILQLHSFMKKKNVISNLTFVVFVVSHVYKKNIYNIYKKKKDKKDSLYI